MDEGQDVFQFFIPNADGEELESFRKREEQCGSLDQWMTVPIAFRIEEGGLKLLSRRSVRATLAFWHERAIAAAQSCDVTESVSNRPATANPCDGSAGSESRKPK
jgi:hypothetical protein